MSFLTGGGKATFERLLDAATSQMLLEPSWVTNLEICDCIRQQDVTSKFAVVAIQKRMRDPNPHVSRFALIVLETCVKNCGQPFHEEIASNDFMDDMRTLAQTGSAPVKEQVLTMLQAWNHAFRNKTQFQPILATYNLMRMEGYKFPPLNESDAMFSSDAAPAWKDGDVCHLCRVKFGTFTRQHHCRACGECFCSKCSSKASIIPKMGIEREVRCCDTCYDELNPNAGKPSEAKTKAEIDTDLPAEYLNSDLAKEVQTKPTLSEEERKAQEEEELQLAMAISLSEEEVKGAPQKSWSLPTSSELIKPPEQPKAPEPPKSTLFSGVSASLQAVAEDNNSELNKYLDRTYWEKKNAELKTREQPSAPAAALPLPPVNQVEYCEPLNDEVVEDSSGSEVFIDTMLKSIEMFTDRMNTVRSKGKHIAMDSTVQSLFQSLSAMHPQLMKLIEDEEESKAKYDAMLQKLAVIREARDSLNDMRAQYQEKVSQQELEQEMLRRMQMEQKLELMRQQKQEYLEYQRQLQIQRQQELETYQLEKLRQKQSYGMNPAFADYPEVPTHAPGSIQLPGYQPIPAARYAEVQYGGEISLQNPQLSYKERVALQPQAESHPEAYQDVDRPPQYPGSPRQFMTSDHDMPPSYASSVATEGVIASNPEYYNQNGEHVQTSQWQQPTSFANELPQNVRPRIQQAPYQHPSHQHQSPQLKQRQFQEVPVQQQQPQMYNQHVQPPPPQHQQPPTSVQQHPTHPPQQLPPQQLPPQQLPPQQLPPQQLQPQQLPPQQLPPQQLPPQQLPPQQLPPQQLPPQQLPPQQLPPQQLPQQQQIPQPPTSIQQQQLPPSSTPHQQLPPHNIQQQHPSQAPQPQIIQGNQQLPLQGSQHPSLPPHSQPQVQQLPPHQQQQGHLPPQPQHQGLPPQPQHQGVPHGQQQLPMQGQQQLPPQGQPQVLQQPQIPQQQQIPQQPPSQIPPPQQQQSQAQYLNQQPPGQMQYYPHEQPMQQNVQNPNDPQFAMNQQQITPNMQQQQQAPQQHQQPMYQQQYPPNQVQVEVLTNNMKDLQLISFD